MTTKNAKPAAQTYVDFPATDGLVLPGFLFQPEKKTTKAVIYLHGNGSSSVFSAGKDLYDQADALAAAGWSYLCFNNRGSGYMGKLRKENGTKVLSGTAYEKIRECVADIDGAIAFLKKLGYKEFALMGFSTGANKICVYNSIKPKNPVSKYILCCGGDDVGIYYRILGKERFWKLLKQSEQKVRARKGEELIMEPKLPFPYSYQGFYDIANPDGDYNTFPYLEAVKGFMLSKKKKLFWQFRKLNKPTLVVYGSEDEYTSAPAEQAVARLQEEVTNPEMVTFAIIKGADHGFTGKEKELNRVVTSWLDTGMI